WRSPSSPHPHGPRSRAACAARARDAARSRWPGRPRTLRDRAARGAVGFDAGAHPYREAQSKHACGRCVKRPGWVGSPLSGGYNPHPLGGFPVKHWAETAAILDRLSELAARGSRAVLATVIRISGSAYRRPGAKLLIEEDGITQGGVSGGCLESDVRAHALRILGGAEHRMLHYDTGSDEETLWGLGLGCEGAVDVYLQRIDGGFMDGPGKQMRELLAAGVPFAAITFLHGRSEGKTLVFARGELAGSSGAPDVDRELSERAGPLLEGDGGADVVEAGHAAFVDVLRPPPRLLIFGAGDDARPLAALAAAAGFEITVVDHRPAYLTAERFPPPLRLSLRRPSEGAAGLPLGISRKNFAVVQTHSLAHDRDW